MNATYDCGATVYNHMKEGTIWMREMKRANAPEFTKHRARFEAAENLYIKGMRAARIKKNQQAAEKKLLEQLIAENIQLSVRVVCSECLNGGMSTKLIRHVCGSG
jgi:hypothetical protein